MDCLISIWEGIVCFIDHVVLFFKSLGWEDVKSLVDSGAVIAAVFWAAKAYNFEEKERLSKEQRVFNACYNLGRQMRWLTIEFQRKRYSHESSDSTQRNLNDAMLRLRSMRDGCVHNDNLTKHADQMLNISKETLGQASNFNKEQIHHHMKLIKSGEMMKKFEDAYNELKYVSPKMFEPLPVIVNVEPFEMNVEMNSPTVIITDNQEPQ